MSGEIIETYVYYTLPCNDKYIVFNSLILAFFRLFLNKNKTLNSKNKLI